MTNTLREEIPEYVKFITLTNSDHDIPWTITLDTKKPDLDIRLRRALEREYCADGVKINKATFSTGGMVGEITATMSCYDLEGETYNRTETFWIGVTSVY